DPFTTVNWAAPRGFPIVPAMCASAFKAPVARRFDCPARARTSERSPLRMVAFNASGWFGPALQWLMPTEPAKCAWREPRVKLPFSTLASDDDAFKSAARLLNLRFSTAKFVRLTWLVMRGDTSGPLTVAEILAVPPFSATGNCWGGFDASAIAGRKSFRFRETN